MMSTLAGAFEFSYKERTTSTKEKGKTFVVIFSVIQTANINLCLELQGPDAEGASLPSTESGYLPPSTVKQIKLD